ncbi:MAG: NAD-binding protein, partial [Planctomycetota bacterium]
LSWMAPRGIVAAAIASVFGISLQQAGVPGAELLTPYIFLVIVVTVAVYGLTCVWVARRLEIANPVNSGFLIAGANPLARQIAKALSGAKTEVLLVDLNYANIQRARLEGLPTLVANVLSPQTHEAIELTSIGRLLALTPNNEVNSLAAVQHGRHFGRSNVFQLSTNGERTRQKAIQKGESAEKRSDVTGELQGRIAFDSGATFDRLETLLASGAAIRQTKLTKAFGYDDWRELNGADEGRAIPLFVVSDDGAVTVLTPESKIQPRAGQALIALAPPAPEPKPVPAQTETTTEVEVPGAVPALA